ncbi:polysaccharide biosynthesis tyrosine autokinase [Stieleria varia]|uniref:non-specific protein-tyrosine kinase n=1 Tax=Stieleria varia TaxID=2528005 RepID=A0A5C6B601_9BACT|nr:polysaccharide biosynthesis tyrosine autokinase [Stieleria varia]TWU05934.1 putative tyrosine-protein kinase in cps region [Stieleria varia]
MLEQDIHQINDAAAGEDLPGLSGESMLTVLWRFKWLLVIFTAVGLGVGYWVYQRKPTTYMASSKLMFRSDKPLILNSQTGVMEGGIPSGNIMQSVITSDSIMASVAQDPALTLLPSMTGKSVAQIAATIRSGVRFQTITNAADSRDRMIASLSFEGGDPALCVAAVNVMSAAISDHFDAERESQLDNLGKLVNQAYNDLLPKYEELVEEYHEFQENSPLKWDKDRQVINPHRERQLRLQAEREDLESEAMKYERELKTADLIRQQNPDPIMVAQMIGGSAGLGDPNRFSEIQSPMAANVLGLGDDLELERLGVEQQLVPLETERAELISQFGDNHPQVVSITSKIENIRRRLNELESQKAARQAQLRAEIKTTDINTLRLKERQERASSFVAAYMGGLAQRLTVLQEDMRELDQKIATEEALADQLHKAENTDKAFNRKMDFLKGMLDELDQRIEELDLANTNGGIVVEPLLNTGNAYVTGPDLKKDLILFGMLGLGLSGLMAMLFEAGAKMFRSAEEIQKELRLPVLSHIPLDESRVQQGKTVMDKELSRLDPKLSVVHRPYSSSAEAIRGIRTALFFDRRAYDSKVFQITSPLPGDGKSTIAANIGCSIAQSGKKVLLIDLDLRSPRMSLRFNLQSDVGLTNVLNGEMSPGAAVHETPIENLDIMACGPLPANPAEALTIAELSDVFDWARANYDFVIVDTPPLLMVSDPAVVTTYVDAAMLVMRIRRRCKPNAKESVAMLRSAGVRIVGVVVNKIDEVSGSASYKASASGSYQSIGYGYGDKYRQRYQKEANATDTYIVKGKSDEAPTVVAPPDVSPTLITGSTNAESTPDESYSSR